MKIPADIGVRELVWRYAMHGGKEQGFDAYINTITKGIDALNTQAKGVAQGVLRSRLAADLAILIHFSNSYKSVVESMLKKGKVRKSL